MKRLLLSTLTIALASAATAPFAIAGQVSLANLEADLNGDGQVSLTELKLYNRSQRQS